MKHIEIAVKKRIAETAEPSANVVKILKADLTAIARKFSKKARISDKDFSSPSKIEYSLKLKFDGGIMLQISALSGKTLNDRQFSIFILRDGESLFESEDILRKNLDRAIQDLKQSIPDYTDVMHSAMLSLNDLAK